MIRWNTYRCRRCRWSVQLPAMWRVHQRALRCWECRGGLRLVPSVPRPLRQRHRRVS
jgi:hypothetical protein